MTACINEIVIRKKKGEEFVTIYCPKCAFRTEVGTVDLQMFARGVRVQCRCSHIFNATFEFRQGFRKNADVEGYYRKFHGPTLEPQRQPRESQNGFNSNCRIKNVSMLGVNFELIGKHSLKVGEKLRIRFKLITSALNKIEKDAVIRSIIGNRIGCEFLSLEHDEKQIGFFMM